jgi:surface polysaccharide O-acyltransferase-like enzyme
LEPKQTAANFSVDTIRFIAIILVIGVHTTNFPYRVLGSSITGLDVTNWFTIDAFGAVSMIGVPLFIMLTGALLLNPNKADEPLRVFYRKRWDRIGLPFIFWTIFYFAWSNLVLHKPLTPLNLADGLLNGAYPILAYLYMLAGLYAITPMLRVLVKNLKRNAFMILLVIWFVGTIATPMIHTFLDPDFNPVSFTIVGWVGYYLMGIYLLNANIRRSIAVLGVALAFTGAIVGDWLITASAGENATGFFHNYMSLTIITAAVASFYLLTKLPANRYEKHKNLNSFIHWVSENTLPIYLIHIIFVYAVQNILFGEFFYGAIPVSLIYVPVSVVLVFFASITTVFVLKKIPYVGKLIG